MTRQELDLQSANDAEDPTNQREDPSALLNEFASYTTLHGCHFILGSSAVIRRIIWASLLLAGVALMACQFYEGHQKLVMRDSISVKELQYDKDIVFPAVTICNQNMLRRSKVLGTPEVQRFMDDIESDLFGEDLKHNINETFALNLDEVVKEGGHNISAMLKLCYWRGQRCGPKDFSLLLSFQRGLCYTFNSGKPGYPIRYPKSAGRSQGLLLQLDAESDQYYGPFNLLDGTGFRVLVHDQSDWPDMENNAIDISPGFSCIIQVQRQKILRLPAPDKSNCGKRKLMTFKSYSQSACFLECWTRHIMEKCRCRTLGMAQIDSNVSRYCGPREIAKCVKTSQVLQISSLDENSSIHIQLGILSSTFSNDVDCDCPLECEKAHYDMKLSSSSFPSRHVLPIIMRRRNASQVNQTEELISKIQTELRKRLLQLNIFYQSTATEVTKEKPAYDIYDFGSDLGGNMGLFLGCSVLTIFEFVDLFLLICLGSCNCRRKVHARP